MQSLVELCSARAVGDSGSPQAVVTTTVAVGTAAPGGPSLPPKTRLCTRPPLKVIVAGVLTRSEAHAVREGLRALGIIDEDVFESIDDII